MNPLPHLIVADAVWRHVSWAGTTRAHMLFGSLAPDSYRVIPGMSFKRLHFRSRRRVGQRLRDFLADHLRPVLRADVPEAQAFWMGWLCHLVSDVVWQRLIHAENPDLWRRCVSSESNEKVLWRENYRNACDCVDREISRQSPQYVTELRWILRQGDPEYDTFPIGRSALNQWLGAVAGTLLPPPEPPHCGDEAITYEMTSRAMDEAREQACALLATELGLAGYHGG